MGHFVVVSRTPKLSSVLSFTPFKFHMNIAATFQLLHGFGYGMSMEASEFVDGIVGRPCFACIVSRPSSVQDDDREYSIGFGSYDLNHLVFEKPLRNPDGTFILLCHCILWNRLS